MDYLKQKAAKMGFSLSDAQLEKFDIYFKTVVEYNKKVNLTSILEKNAFVEKHFLDSISAAPFLKEGASFCDIGSGAGFPAIPLKIIRPDLEMTLFDSLKKRVDFLNFVTDLLGLDNISAVHTRAEDAAKTFYRASFDCVAARAVASLPTLLEYAIPLLKTGAVFVAYKTDEGEAEAAKTASALLHAKHTQSFPYALPDGSKRTLLIFQKTAPTPAKYPRPANKPKTSPL